MIYQSWVPIETYFQGPHDITNFVYLVVLVWLKGGFIDDHARDMTRLYLAPRLKMSTAFFSPFHH